MTPIRARSKPIHLQLASLVGRYDREHGGTRVRGVGMGGARVLGRTVALVALSTGVVFAAGGSLASAALISKGTLHIEYNAAGTFTQVDQAGSNPTTSQAQVTWKAVSDIPLAGNGQYRYTPRNGKTGTISATATLTGGGVNCSGELTIASSNGIDYVGQFEFDYGKKGSALTNKGTLIGVSPVPVSSGFVGQFTDANGTGCTGDQPVVSVGSSPNDTEGKIVLKVDLDKLSKSKSKSKTYDVGLTKTYDASYKTDVSWKGTVVVTLQK